MPTHEGVLGLRARLSDLDNFLDSRLLCGLLGGVINTVSGFIMFFCLTCFLESKWAYGGSDMFLRFLWQGMLFACKSKELA